MRNRAPCCQKNNPLQKERTSWCNAVQKQCTMAPQCKRQCSAANQMREHHDSKKKDRHAQKKDCSNVKERSQWHKRRNAVMWKQERCAAKNNDLCGPKPKREHHDETWKTKSTMSQSQRESVVMRHEKQRASQKAMQKERALQQVTPQKDRVVWHKKCRISKVRVPWYDAENNKRHEPCALKGLAPWRKKQSTAKPMREHIYKTKIHWNKGGVPLVLLVVRLVFWVYSPSSSLPDYRLCVTGPRIFTRARLFVRWCLKEIKTFVYVRFCTDDI